MKKVIMLVMILGIVWLNIDAVQQEDMQDLGESIRDSGFLDQAPYQNHYRLKRTRSEGFIAEKLQKDFDQLRVQMQKDKEEKEEQSKNENSKEEAIAVRSSNAITSSLTSSMQVENSSNNSSEFRINGIDIAAKLIRLREVQNKDHDVVIEIRDHINALKKNFNSPKLIHGAKIGLVVSGFIILFLITGISVLLAAHH